MMELDESLGALYFAPVAMIVLNENRRIKVLNRAAEVFLGIDSTKCAGELLEQYVASSSRKMLFIALNEASQNSSNLSSHSPVSTRMQFHPAGSLSSIRWAEMSISAWFPTEPILNSVVGTLQSPQMDTSNFSSASTSSNSLSQHVRAPHEAMYTISIVPSISPDPDEKEGSSKDVNIEEFGFLESVFQNLEMPALALSKDGKFQFVNRATLNTLSFFSRAKDNGVSNSIEKDEHTNQDFLSWVSQTLTVYDEEFQTVTEEAEWPIYRSANFGDLVNVVIGLESKVTGERIILDLTSKPIYDKADHGMHIGGLLSFRNITEERQKRKTEAEMLGDLQFKHTIDIMPQIVWTSNPTGSVEWYSKQFYAYTGVNKNEAQGSGWQILIHEDEVEELGKKWSHSLRTTTPMETAYRMKRHDGVWRWFLGTAVPMLDSSGNPIRWFGTCTDIHDQVATLATSREAQDKLQTVINHAAVTLWSVDREGIITLAEGPRLQQLNLTVLPVQSSTRQSNALQEAADCSANYSHEGEMEDNCIVGQSIYQVWNAEIVRDSIAKALAGETVVGELEIDGRCFRNSYTPLRTQVKDVLPLYNGSYDSDEVNPEMEGEIIGVVGASMDISEVKEAQQRMEESMLEKTRALAAEHAAEEASRLKSQFLANMSHEIRTPIAGVIGLSELVLEEGNLTVRQREYIQTVQTTAEGLLTVINDVLDFSKVEIGKLELEEVPFDLRVMLQDLRRIFAFAMKKKGLEFKESINLSYNGKLMGDLCRLRQIYTNLLTNAIKFTTTGYIILDVEEIFQDDEQLLVRFDIRDTGCGIQPDTLSRLFHPFTQADASTARVFGGTGLGLSISKNLVNLMHGEIGLNSIEGQGSHAWFQLPFRKVVQLQKEPTVQALVSVVESPDFSFYNESNGDVTIIKTISMNRPRSDVWILIAEDNDVNARIASRNIEKMGFSCQVAANGLIAMEILTRNRFELVLMDCQMPICDGYKATQLIRKSHNTNIRTLPIIALTASAIKGDRERALGVGMNDYIAKPMKRSTLEIILCKWLYDNKTRQNLAKFLFEAPTCDQEMDQTIS